MNKKWIWFGILLMFMNIIGCSADRRILEKTGFVSSLSMDAENDNQIRLALSLPSTDPQRDVASIFLTTVANGSKDGRAKLSKETNLILANGQLRSALFGIPLAKKGIWELMDAFFRDPTVTNRLKIVMVEDDAGALLGKNYKEHPRTSVYIDRLLIKESRRYSIPDTTLYSFSRDYYDDGIDPVAPVIKINGENVAVDGIGLFKGDQYVAKISSQDSLVFSMLYGDVRGGDLSINLSQEEDQRDGIMLTAITSTRDIQVIHDQNQKIRINLDVVAQGSVLEYIGELRPSDEAQERELEQTVSKYLTEKAENVIKLIQDKQSDNLGLGSYVRNSMAFADWKEMDWHEKLSEVEVNCSFHLTFKDYGFRY